MTSEVLIDDPELVTNPGDATLVVSELVTNAVKHGTPPIILRLFPGDALRIEVCDTSAGVPAIPDTPRPDVPGGRGLLLTDSVSQAWGVEWRHGGKCVWAYLA